ncbi:hypothetical protein GCM10023317_67560 [Actinopolymorpha pittospori]
MPLKETEPDAGSLTAPFGPRRRQEKNDAHISVDIDAEGDVWVLLVEHKGYDVWYALTQQSSARALELLEVSEPARHDSV